MDVQAVLKKLTIDEKIRLLNGVGDWHTYDCDQKVPSIMMTDGPHGIRKVEDEKIGDINTAKKATCFPTASAMASSWNPQMTYKMASAIADEALQEKISIVLGCGINIKRSPLCGRNFEYFSEDPYLTGKLASSYIKGLQDKKVGTSLKHFAVNSQETRRMTSNSQVDERALREIYLAAFEEVVKESQPTTIMASYNRINGHYACANEHLLKDILRDEWGYKGAVVSDWGACIDVVKCVKAGMDLEMPFNHGYHTKVLKDAFERGEISQEEIDRACKKVLASMTALSENVVDDYKVDYGLQDDIACELSKECAVLLKNKGSFPVRKKKLIVIGELAKEMRYQGGGSSHIVAARHKNALESLVDQGYEVWYAKGYSNDTDVTNIAYEDEALKLIEKVFDEDTHILFFMGLTDKFEGEGYDRKTLALPSNQVELLAKVSVGVSPKNVSAVSFGGAAMDYSWDKYVSGILHMHLGGQAVGRAAAELISGKANPSGRLSETIPLSLETTPAYRYFAPNHDDIEYRESIFVGYRYYESFGVEVKYPFGYGLSYTSFEYSDLKLNKVVSSDTNALKLIVSFKVTNTGNVAGKEVSQLYVIAPEGNFLRSKIELRGFEKVYLEPGQTREISLELNDRSFSVYDISKKEFLVISGKYQIGIGKNVKEIVLKEDIEIEGQEYFRDERSILGDYFKANKAGMDISQEQFEILYGKDLSKLSSRKRGDFDMTTSFGDIASQSLFGRIFKLGVAIAIHFMFPGKKKDDPEMKMIVSGLNEGALEGLITNSGGVLTPKLADMLLWNANRKYGKAFMRMFKKN